MENILIGTTSESKLKIVKDFFEQQGKEYNILPRDVSSEIADQPLDEDTTILGATNRARNAAKNDGEFIFSIGLEGGLLKINGLYYLICIAVMIDNQGKQFIGMSSELPIPRKVSDQIENGEQFGDTIRVFRKENSDKSQILVDHLDELIERKKSFTEALRIAFLIFSLQEDFYK